MWGGYGAGHRLFRSDRRYVCPGPDRHVARPQRVHLPVRTPREVCRTPCATAGFSCSPSSIRSHVVAESGLGVCKCQGAGASEARRKFTGPAGRPTTKPGGSRRCTHHDQPDQKRHFGAQLHVGGPPGFSAPHRSRNRPMPPRWNQGRLTAPLRDSARRADTEACRARRNGEQVWSAPHRGVDHQNNHQQPPRPDHAGVVPLVMTHRSSLPVRVDERSNRDVAHEQGMPDSRVTSHAET
jgi:hypothetical protein